MSILKRARLIARVLWFRVSAPCDVCTRLHFTSSRARACMNAFLEVERREAEVTRITLLERVIHDAGEKHTNEDVRRFLRGLASMMGDSAKLAAVLCGNEEADGDSMRDVEA